MIKKHLASCFKLGRLNNIWLISGNCELTIIQVKEFLNDHIFEGSLSLQTNPDFLQVERITVDNSKNISVEQIRKLQEFLNKKPVLFNYKAVIIYEAELMNLAAANSCLKILEDVTSNCLIFLLTSRPAQIISTIRSRCNKLEISLTSDVPSSLPYQELIAALDKEYAASKRLEFMAKFYVKDRALWVDFIEAVTTFLSRIVKKTAGTVIALEDIESKIMQQIKNKTIEKLLIIYEYISKLSLQTINLDLDLRVSYLLIINILHE